LTNQDVLKKYPRLTAHLIAESLGYFTPEAAAGAILAHKEKRPYRCEWYSHIVGLSRKSYEEVNADTIRLAFQFRHYHKGFMRDYRSARCLVDATLEGKGPVFASWF
jgi:hypothetical protein